MSSLDCKTYLGPKGYSVFKQKISIQEQQYIRDNLTVKPLLLKPLSLNPNLFPFIENRRKSYIYLVCMV